MIIKLKGRHTNKDREREPSDPIRFPTKVSRVNIFKPIRSFDKTMGFPKTGKLTPSWFMAALFSQRAQACYQPALIYKQIFCSQPMWTPCTEFLPLLSPVRVKVLWFQLKVALQSRSLTLWPSCSLSQLYASRS